jgi:hypothetical protein
MSSGGGPRRDSGPRSIDGTECGALAGATAEAKTEKDGFTTLPEGTTATLYAAHSGVGLTVSKVDAFKCEGGLVTARTTRRELYVVEIVDVYAVALDAATSGPVRRAGFG